MRSFGGYSLNELGDAILTEAPVVGSLPKGHQIPDGYCRKLGDILPRIKKIPY